MEIKQRHVELEYWSAHISPGDTGNWGRISLTGDDNKGRYKHGNDKKVLLKPLSWLGY